MIPVLFITYNRLEYTKQALKALLASDCGDIFIIDNASSDGTREWLDAFWLNRLPTPKIHLFFNDENRGIAGVMNQFLKLTKNYQYVGKVDNDTIVPENWSSELLKKMIALDLDIIQAKHNILPLVTQGRTFNEWVNTMPQDKRDPSVYYHRFVGGSGMIFKRSIIEEVPETEWKLYGWVSWQKKHSELKKAFTTDVEIHLLDGGGDYSKYPEYYKEVGRL